MFHMYLKTKRLFYCPPKKAIFYPILTEQFCRITIDLFSGHSFKTSQLLPLCYTESQFFSLRFFRDST